MTRFLSSTCSPPDDAIFVIDLLATR